MDMLSGEHVQHVWIKFGQSEVSDQSWTRINAVLPGMFNPVVFLGIGVTSFFQPPLTPRMKLVDASSFDVKLFQPNDSFCSKQWHIPIHIAPSISIPWMVVEAGAFELMSHKFFIGKGNISRQDADIKNDLNYARMDYPIGCDHEYPQNPCTFSDSVSVIALTQLQTCVHARILSVRGNAIRRQFSRFILQPHDSLDQSYFVLKEPEVLGYIAFESGTSIDCTEGWAFRSYALNIVGFPVNVTFSNFQSTPTAFGSVGSSTSLTDSVVPKLNSISFSNATLSLQEDECVDEEVSHPSKEVLFLLIVGELDNTHQGLEDCMGVYGSQTRFPSSLPTPIPSHSPSHFPSTTPSQFPSLWPSLRPSPQPLTHPSKLPTWSPVAIPTPNSYPSGHPSSMPSSSPSSIPSFLPTRVPTRSPSEVPTPWPSILPTNVPSSCPTSKPSPCPTMQPSNSPSIVPSTAPTILHPPRILSRVLSPYKYSVDVALTLDTEGSVYCEAFQPLQYVPSQAQAITRRNIVGTSINRYVVVTIDQLSPLTNYNVFCITSTKDKSMFMPFAVALNSPITTTTSCCGNIRALNTAKQHLIGSPKALMTLSLSRLPYAYLRVDIAVLDIDTGIVTHDVDIFPKQWEVHNSSRLLSLSILIWPNRIGRFQLAVSTFGESAIEYDIDDSLSQIFEVQGSAVTMSPPTMTKAEFLYDGTSLIVVFSDATNKAGVAGHFDCTNIFDFVGAADSKCGWINSSVVSILPLGRELLCVGDSIHLKGNKLKLECTVSNCDSWRYSFAHGINVTAPASAVKPVVSISVPTQISSCSSLNLDLSSSYGNGGRKWAIVLVNISETSDPDTSDLSKHLTDFEIGKSSIIPSTLLRGGYSYKFAITLCNFFNKCTSSNSRHIMVSNSRIPVVTLPGSSTREVYRSQELKLSLNLEYPKCGSLTTDASTTAVISWELFRGDYMVPNVHSLSLSKYIFRLQPYALEANAIYTIHAFFRVPNLNFTTSVAVDVFVKASPIIARIKGPSTVSIRSGQFIDLDGSSSFDSDQTGGGGGMSAGLSFQWLCTQTHPLVASANCPVLMIGSLQRPTITITPKDNTAVSNITVRFILHVAHLASGRVSDAEVYVSMAPQSAPLLTIENPTLGQVHNPDQKLKLLAWVESSSSGSSIWSVDDSAIDLAAISLTPIQISNQMIISTIHLIVSAGSLPAASTLTFTLTSTNMFGESSQSAVTVVTNAAPTPGSFEVSPQSGLELIAEFNFAALYWSDDADLPITYDFGFIDSFGGRVSLQMRSEVSSMSTYLNSPSNHSVECLARVYDSLSSFASSIYIVDVLPAQNFTSATLLKGLENTFDALIRNYSFGLDKIVSTYGAALNNANCSRSPDCGTLNRKMCSSTPHTCSGCNLGFRGENGHHNTVCIPSSVGNSRRLDSANCTLDSDCPGSTECDVITKTCISMRKQCPSDCSFHGYCKFEDQYTMVVLEKCFISDSHCVARCICQPGYVGNICEHTTEELADRTLARESLIALLLDIVFLGSSESEVQGVLLEGWAQSLSLLVQDSIEISDHSREMSIIIAESILEHATDVSFEYILTLFEPLFVLMIPSNSSTPSIIYETWHQSIYSRYGDYWNVLSEYDHLIGKDMVYGQESVWRTSPSVSTLITVIRLDGNDTNYLYLPAAGSLRILPGLAKTVSIEVVMTDASVLRPAMKSYTLSDSLRLALSPEDYSADEGQLLTSLEFILPIKYPVYFHSENFTTICKGDENITYNCLNGLLVVADCAGRKGTLVSRCPTIELKPICNMFNDNMRGSECSASVTLSEEVLCRCTVTLNSSRSFMDLVSTKMLVTKYHIEIFSEHDDDLSHSITMIAFALTLVIALLCICAIIFVATTYGEKENKNDEHFIPDLHNSDATLRAREVLATFPSNDAEDDAAKPPQKVGSVITVLPAVSKEVAHFLQSVVPKIIFLSPQEGTFGYLCAVTNEVIRFHKWLFALRLQLTASSFEDGNDNGWQRADSLKALLLSCNLVVVSLIVAIYCDVIENGHLGESCTELGSTEDKCTVDETSIFVFSLQTKCMWSTQSNTCEVVNLNTDYPRMVFVALMSSITAIPFILVFEHTIGTYLSTQTTSNPRAAEFGKEHVVNAKKTPNIEVSWSDLTHFNDLPEDAIRSLDAQALGTLQMSKKGQWYLRSKLREDYVVLLKAVAAYRSAICPVDRRLFDGNI